MAHRKSAARSLKTCILSSHPFFLSEFQKLIPLGRLAPPARQLDRHSHSEASAHTLPRAAVYVIDGQHSDKNMAMIAAIREHRPRAHLLVVGDSFSEEIAFALLQAGVKGLLTYSAARQQLPRAVEAVADGRLWMPRALLSKFVESMLQAPPKLPRSDAVLRSASRREKEILEHLLDNRSNKEIANQLNISERTVKFHVSNLLAKSGVQRRTDLILLALQAQNISPRAIQ
jgi:DNA-binding NarL/FixJ family response regulator